MDLDFRPDDPAFLTDPYPLFTRLRDDDPCHYSPRLKSWVLTRYDDVRRVCTDRAMSSDRLRPFFQALPSPEAEKLATITRYLSQWMVFKDAPEHTRLRRLANQVFHVRSMQAMRPTVERITARLLRDVGDREQIDFIKDFAGPLPALVIMAMLGVPEEDLSTIKRLSDDMALFIGSSRANPEKYATAESATREMAALFRELIESRRAGPRDDVLSALLAARDGPDGADGFSDDELVGTCILLLFAGHETTTNHLANGLLALTRFPSELEKLRADPSLAVAAVEELLRYDGPTAALVRIVTTDHELHGKSLRAGERVFVMLHAANRDPRTYPDPDRVDLTRDGAPHLAFGFGPHLCLGFPLARVEGQVALPAVLRHFAEIEPATHERPWLESMVFRGMTSFPLRVRRV
jgi:cytochrome P450